MTTHCLFKKPVLRPLIEPGQCRAHRFQGSLAWLGIEDDAAFVGEPQGNGVAERFIRTLKEQCLWARLCADVDDLRQGVVSFIETYNNEWLIERLGHRTPREVLNEGDSSGSSVIVRESVQRTGAATADYRQRRVRACECQPRMIVRTALLFMTIRLWGKCG